MGLLVSISKCLDDNNVRVKLSGSLSELLSTSVLSKGARPVVKAVTGSMRMPVTALSVLGATLFATPAMAQSSLPAFTCEADAYNVFGSNPSNIQRFNPANLSVLSTIPVDSGVTANAIGFNPLDNYIYGLSSNAGGGGLEFVRLGVDGSFEALGAPTPATPGLPAFTPSNFAGVMDASGNWYGLTNSSLFIVNVGNAPANGALTYTVIARSGNTSNLLDIAFNPLDGDIYGIGGGQLRRINVSTGNGTTVATTGDATFNSGGAWSTSDGTLFFYRNGGGSPSLSSIDTSQSPAVVTNLGVVPGNGNFDSAACLPPTLTKGVLGSGPDADGRFAYEFTIANAFSNPITVNFNDPLPSELRYVPGSLSPAAPGGASVSTFTTTDLALSNIQIPAIGTTTFSVMVELAPNLAAGTTVNNQASIEFGGSVIPSDDPDTNVTNDGTAFNVPVIANLTLVKAEPTNADEDGSGTVTAGDTLTYTITATNDSNGQLNNVIVSDPLLAAPNDTTTCATLAVGATCVLTGIHEVTSDEANAGTVDNTASVVSDEVTTAVEASVSVTVEMPQADLSITKTNTPGVNGGVDQADDTVTSGQMTTYTIVVTNNGPDSVTGAVVTDTPSGDLTCPGTNAVTISGDGVPTGTFTIADLTGAGISLENLDDGQSTTLTYSCEVN